MARATRDVWINPPPIPLTTAEMDYVFDLPYARSPHPAYADENGSHDHATKIPAWEMIRFSINIMRGCFGGCTFCSITEHEGRIIQSRSEESVINEIEDIRDKVKGFTGTISDLGGPTANMYRTGLPHARDRGGLPQAQLRLPRHLPEPDHRPRPADQDLPPWPRAQGRQEDSDQLRRALRPGDPVSPSTSRNWSRTTSAAT